VKRAELGYMERYVVAEKLARAFYSLMGYKAPEEPHDCMAKSQHPQEQACYAMAWEAITFFTEGS